MNPSLSDWCECRATPVCFGMGQGPSSPAVHKAFYLSVLEMEPSAVGMLSNSSTTELLTGPLY